jgi:hypothetical protein
MTSLHPDTACCRTLTLPGGWQLKGDPARVPGYFADDPKAKLIYRLDASSEDVLIGLELEEDEGRAAEVCPRHFAVALSSGGVTEASEDRWQRARPIVKTEGFWNSGDSHLFRKDRTFLGRVPKDAGLPSTSDLSPDSRFLLSWGRDGSFAHGSVSSVRPGDLRLTIYGTGSGKALASASGQFSRDGAELLGGGTWISDRHLIFASRPDRSELILCDLGAYSPAGKPVIPLVPDQPELMAFDASPLETWSYRRHGNNEQAPPVVTAIGLLPAGQWDLQWRATNAEGRDKVVLVERSGPGFRSFDYPISFRLGGGSYRIGDAVFLQHDGSGRVRFPGVQFETPVFRPEGSNPDGSPNHARWRREPSHVPEHKSSLIVELRISGKAVSTKDGATRIYTVDCIAGETPPPTVGFTTIWDAPGQTILAKPDTGPCTMNATKLYVTDTERIQEGRYMLSVEARAGQGVFGEAMEIMLYGPGGTFVGLEGQQQPAKPQPEAVPLPVAVVPYWGSGSQQRFSFVALRPDGGGEIATIEARIAWLPEASAGCRFRFDTVHGGVSLLDDSGKPAGPAGNGFCLVTSPGMERDGDSVTVSALVEFKSGAPGPRGVYVRVADRAGFASPLELLGAWKVR